MDFRTHLLETRPAVDAMLARVRRIAVLGIKTEEQRAYPAFYVPAYLVAAGFDVVPVPVYYPEATRILGRPVVRDLRAVPPPVDLVDVFRKSDDLPAHLDDLLALKPGAVWFQLGIRHDEVARKLAEAGIDVVQDRCLMVEHRQAVARGTIVAPLTSGTP